MFTGKTLIQLLRQGWDEIPEFVVSSGVASVGMLLTFLLLRRLFCLYRQLHRVMKLLKCEISTNEKCINRHIHSIDIAGVLFFNSLVQNNF